MQDYIINNRTSLQDETKAQYSRFLFFASQRSLNTPVSVQHGRKAWEGLQDRGGGFRV